MCVSTNKLGCTHTSTLSSTVPCCTRKFPAYCHAHKSAAGLPWPARRASAGANTCLIRLKSSTAATNQLQAAAGDRSIDVKAACHGPAAQTRVCWVLCVLLSRVAGVCPTLFNCFRKSGRATSGPLFLEEIAAGRQCGAFVSRMAARNFLLPSVAAPHRAAATRTAGGHHPNNTICSKRFQQRLPFSSAQLQKRKQFHHKLLAVVRFAFIAPPQQRVILQHSSIDITSIM